MARRGRLILIVDPDLDFVEDARLLLNGERLLAARSLEEAEEIAVGGRVDAAVLGPSFGNEAGVRAAAGLLAVDATIHLVLVANVVTNRVLLAALQSGFADVVDAPLTARKLATALAPRVPREAPARVLDVVVETVPYEAAAPAETFASSAPVPAVLTVAVPPAPPAPVPPAPLPAAVAVVPPAPAAPEPVAATAPTVIPAAPESIMIAPVPVAPAAAPVAAPPVVAVVPPEPVVPEPVVDALVPVAAAAAAPPIVEPPIAAPVVTEHGAYEVAPPAPPVVPVLPDPPPVELPSEEIAAVAPPPPASPPPLPERSEPLPPPFPPRPQVDPPRRPPHEPEPDIEPEPATEAEWHTPLELDDEVPEELLPPAPEDSRVIVVMAGKGGSGKSVTATNLAMALTFAVGEDAVAIVDADLQFGDVALLLQMDPTRSLAEVARQVDDLSEARLDALLLRHESGLRVLPAPLQPAAAGSVTPKSVIQVVERMRRLYRYVVVDTGAVLDDVLLSLLDHADDVVVVVDMDLPSVKNAKVALDILRSGGYPMDRLHLAVNRINSKARLDLVELERSLGLRTAAAIPSDRLVPQSVNEGVPVVALSPRSRVARAFTGLAKLFLPESGRKAS